MKRRRPLIPGLESRAMFARKCQQRILRELRVIQNLNSVCHFEIRKGIETQIATLTACRKSLIHEGATGQRRISA